jgi:hypothetical protein
MSDYKDRGYKSRKMVMAYVVMALGTLGYLAAGHWHGLAVVYPEYCMFLIGASGVYVGGNAAAKLIAARNPRKYAPESSSGETSST